MGQSTWGSDKKVWKKNDPSFTCYIFFIEDKGAWFIGNKLNKSSGCTSITSSADKPPLCSWDRTGTAVLQAYTPPPKPQRQSVKKGLRRDKFAWPAIHEAGSPRPYVFDMETGDPDDVLTLLFLGSHPNVDLRAVTITPGSTEQVALVRWILEKMDLTHIRLGAQ